MKILIKVIFYILLYLGYIYPMICMIDSDSSILSTIIFSIVYIIIYFLIIIPFIDSLIAYFSKGGRNNGNKSTKRAIKKP